MVTITNVQDTRMIKDTGTFKEYLAKTKTSSLQC